MNKTEVSGQRKSFKSRTYVAVKNDISIVFCTDLSVKESIKSTIGNWSKKGLLKNFIFIESYENNQFLASECINGQYIEILDLKRKLLYLSGTSSIFIDGKNISGEDIVFDYINNSILNSENLRIKTENS